MPKRNEVIVTADQLETFAFEYGRTLTIKADRAELQIGSRLFVAPLSLPAVRTPVDEAAS